MKYVSHKDAQSLLEAVELLHSDLTAETLPNRTMRAVEKLIQAELVAFDGFGSDNKYTVTAWASQPHLYTPERLEVFREFVHQHPLIPIALGNKIQSAIKMTDYIAQSEFENLELYNEYFRHVGVRRQMGLTVPVSQDFTYTCSVNRWEDDFTERDRLLLTLISPHLANTIHNSFAYERLNFVIEEQSTASSRLIREEKHNS